MFRIKRNSDGSIQRHKTWVVAKGFQTPDVDFFETFSPVVKASTIRIVLTIAVSYSWDLWQLDFNNAFLNETLEEDVYMAQPLGYIDARCPDYVCKLCKAIYGLKKALRAWNHTHKSAFQS